MRNGVRSEFRKDDLPLLDFDRMVVSKVTDLAGRDVGRSVRLTFADDPAREVTVELPRDGDTVYLEDSEGNTTDSVRWFEPRAQRRGGNGRELRVTERPVCPPNIQVPVWGPYPEKKS